LKGVVVISIYLKNRHHSLSYSCRLATLAYSFREYLGEGGLMQMLVMSTVERLGSFPAGDRANRWKYLPQMKGGGAG
jgi:hypothetical protein